MNEIEKSMGNLPAYLSQDTGETGFEGLGEGWFKNQYLSIAQSNSKKVMEQSPEYIDGLKAGLFFSPSSKKIIGKSARVILLGAWDSITEKTEKGTDGEFVARLRLDEFQLLGLGREHRDGKYWINPENGHTYEQQKNFFVILADEPDEGTFIYSVAGSGFRSVKTWITAAANTREKVNGVMRRAKMFERVWELTTLFVDDAVHNSSYFTLGDVKDCGWVDEGIYDTVHSGFLQAQETIRAGLGDIVESPKDDPIPY